MTNDFTVRAATMADAEQVIALMNAAETAEDGTPDADLQTLLSGWEAPDFDLANDTILVVAPDGTLVGFCDVVLVEDGGEVEFDGYVHPDFQGRGVGTLLVRRAEARAMTLMERLPADMPVGFNTGINLRNAAAVQLLQNAGLEPIRYFYHMGITLDAPPAAPVLADGITMRGFVQGQDERAFYEALEEAFADHWRHVRPTFEEWLRIRTEHDAFDPGLLFMAMDGDEIAGIAFNKYRAGRAWVMALGTRRAWRRKGIAMALLQQSFGEFYRRGERYVGLGVDASNPTGATKLYEAAGMHIAREFVVMEKQLRAGAQPPLSTV